MIDISFKQNAVSFSLNCTDLTFTEYGHRLSTTPTVDGATLLKHGEATDNL
jgi:hypothetical protein